MARARVTTVGCGPELGVGDKSQQQARKCVIRHSYKCVIIPGKKRGGPKSWGNMEENTLKRYLESLVTILDREKREREFQGLTWVSG